MVGEMKPPNRNAESPQWGDFFSGKNFIKFLLVISFPLFGPWGLCFAQSARLPYSFDQIKIGNNALENDITCLLKDHDGFLWLGTNSGLQRYDPNFPITFKHNSNDKNSLVNDAIEALCEDQQGRIWVGANEGICYFDKKKNHFVSFEELNQPDYACRNIICDSRGDIWFSIRDKGLFRFESKTNKLTNFSNESKNQTKISNNRVSRFGLLEDPNKKGLWIACIDKLNFYDFATTTFINEKNNPKNLPIFKDSGISALTINQNMLVFSHGDNQEIWWYDTRQNKVVKTLKPIDKNNHPLIDISQLFFDSNNDLWISTAYFNMAYYNLKLNQTIGVGYEKGNKTSFSAYFFHDILQEKNGTIWFATPNGICTINGLAVLKSDDQLFNIYDLSQEVFKNHPDDGFSDFVEDNTDSTLWLVTFQNRLINYNLKTNQFKEWAIPKQNFLLKYDFPNQVRQYEGKLLIFKPFSIHLFNKKTKGFEKIPIPIEIEKSLKIDMISHVSVLGDSVWIFRKANSIKKSLLTFCYHFKKKQWKIYPIIFEKGAELREINMFFGPTRSIVSKKGDFWIAIHSGGLAKFSKEKQVFEVVKTKQKIDFTKSGYTGFAEDKAGNFWLGTYDLLKFNPETRDLKVALERDAIGSLLIDSNDNVCMVTADEVMFYNEKRNKKYSFTFDSNEPYNYWGSRLNNLKSSKILCVNKQSLVLINFKELKIPSFNDQLYINQVTYADTTILLHNTGSEIKFKADINSFAVHFGLLSTPKNRLYRFEYQLEGYDKDWVLSGGKQNYIVFSNLSGGDYTFKVRAKDVNGNFLPTQKLFIHIDTVFYKTTWFLVLCLLLAGLLAYSFVKYRTNQRKEIHHLQLQSTRLEKDKTEIQYQNLINHLNPHFLFNSLTSLNGLILSEPDVASDFLQKLSKIYRYILQNKDNEIVSLEQELTFVKNYIDLQKSRFEDGLQVNIDIDDDNLSSGIVPVTLQNLFENAIKHNTVEEDKPLIINVFIEDEYLIVKNNLQKKKFVETSNKLGLDSLKSLYKYLTDKPLETVETETEFVVRVPLL